MTDSDQALLAAVARGDKKALEHICLMYKDDLLTLSVWLLCDNRGNRGLGLAEDVLHDMFVSLARDVGRVELRGRLKKYLCASYLNRGRDIMPRNKHEHAANEDKRAWASAPTHPVDASVFNEQHELLTAAMGLLPAEQHEVVGLCIQGQFNIRESAQLLKVSINTMQSRYRYALRALKTTLVS